MEKSPHEQRGTPSFSPDGALREAFASVRRRTMTAREIARFSFREALFRRRGMAVIEAEKLADRLQARDADRDDRRVCRECAAFRPQHRCAASGIPVVDVLQRCSLFAWETPQ